MNIVQEGDFGFFEEEKIKEQLTELRIIAHSSSLQPYQKKFKKTPYMLQKFQLGLLKFLNLITGPKVEYMMSKEMKVAIDLYQ
jgi:hypothetical protein